MSARIALLAALILSPACFAQDGPRVGDEVVLATEIPAAVDEASFVELNKRLLAKDVEGIDKLAADGKVKSAILAGNAAGLFNLRKEMAEQPWRSDLLAQAKAEYRAAGGKPSNQYYGFIRKSGGMLS